MTLFEWAQTQTHPHLAPEAPPAIPPAPAPAPAPGADAAGQDTTPAASPALPPAARPDTPREAPHEPVPDAGATGQDETPATTPPPPATPPTTLMEALARAATDPAIPPARLRRWRGAVNALGKVTRRPVGELPIAPAAVGPLMAAVLPAAFGLSIKRWWRVKSDLRSLAIWAGVHAPRPRDCPPADPAWAALLAILPSSSKCFVSLRPFASFCAGQHIAPHAVDDVTLERYAEWRRVQIYDPEPKRTAAHVRRAWNQACRTQPGWPAQRIAVPVPAGVQALPCSQLSPAFIADLDAYLAALADPDPFDPLRKRPLQPMTILHRRRLLVRAASILVRQGQPPAQVDGLRALATEAAMRGILTMLYEIAGRRWTKQAGHLAAALCDVARRHLRCDEAALKPLLQLRAIATPRPVGLGSRSRTRLETFDDPRMIDRLFALPEQLTTMAEGARRRGRMAQAARAHERALALELVLTVAMRRRNLEALDVVRHFERDPRGRIRRLRIPAAECKGSRGVDVDIAAPLAARIERHLAEYRPTILDGAHSELLFPGKAGQPRYSGTLARIVAHLVTQALGAEFNLHLVRHLVATLLYDDDPANGPVVQRLLGHTQLKITESLYGTIRTRGAHRRYSELLERRRDAVRRREARTSGDRRG